MSLLTSGNSPGRPYVVLGNLARHPDDVMTDFDTDDARQPDRQPDRQPLLDLSLPQLVAGATAAATSAILISRLGLLGTVLGALVVVGALVVFGLVSLG